MNLKNVTLFQYLCSIGQNLPNLNKLSCGIIENQPTSVAFLACMPKLESLDLQCQWYKQNNNTLNFIDSKHHQLQRLSLYKARHTLRWIEHFPNLCSLKLVGCKMQSLQDFFLSIAELQHLRTVKLDAVKVFEKECRSGQHSTRIEQLEVRFCNFPKLLLTSLIASCPNLTKVRLEFMEILDDAALAHCKNFKYLKLVDFSDFRHNTVQSWTMLPLYSDTL